MNYNNNLFVYSSNELTYARNIQQQISQKEFEIKLVDINNKYTSLQDSSSYYYNQQRKSIAEKEISNLKTQRDRYINNSLTYALELAENEITSKYTFSMAAIAISSIRSFISINNVENLVLVLPVIVKISTIWYQLQMNPTEFSSLRTEITNLKMQFHLL
jgi:hypothetical protein